ncbi:MAG: 5,5-dehydrodivanillate O-demethylase oxygenase subunit [Chloroflexota bacterium]|nr:5,5-dehydrodivanillate O-demethylase oxygenase subunit [Chloroflexota bacterium]
MLTAEENQLLTQVGPGTPGGELLRRYWQPVGVVPELTAEHPTKRVRVLGEDLVLYMGEDGSYHLIAEQCAHRGASLYYGFVEGCNLRCPYHGWVYDPNGRILEQPFEPAESMMKHVVHQAAYPVQQMRGLLFAYLGPLPAPILPRWDVIAREDGTHKIEIHPLLEANWLQVQETNVDPTHNTYLHSMWNYKLGLRKDFQFRPIELDFEISEWGIVKRRHFGGADGYREEGHPAIFPNMLRHSSGHGPIDLFWRVPTDDTHTLTYWLGFNPSPDGSIQAVEVPPVEYIELKDADGAFHMHSFPSQDSMAWETQGPIRDRSLEHLGVGDKGVVMLRQLLKQQIDLVREGGDPMGIIRDPAQDRLISFSASK